MAKNVNSRMRQKCDTKANWQSAINNSNFAPLDGEVIIVKDAFTLEADENGAPVRTHPGVKLGVTQADGTDTPLANLPYLNKIVDRVETEADGVRIYFTDGASILSQNGAAAGFGTITATVDDTTGTPNVKVTTSGDNTAKNIQFEFSGLKGAPGEGSGSVDLTNIDLIGQGDSTLISENVAAFGKLNIVGQKGFNIVIPEDSTATGEDGKIYPILPTDWIKGSYYILDSVEGLAVGDTFSIRLTEHRYNYSSITEIHPTTNKVVVKNFYNEDNLLIKNDPRFWVLNKRSVGTIDIGKAAFAAGIENKSQGYCSIALGGYNKAQGYYGAAIGQNNIVRYCGCAIGKDNQNTGNCGVTIGDANRASEYGAVALGVRNSVSVPAGVALGVDNTVSARAAAAIGDGLIAQLESQVVVGKFNAKRSGSIFIVGTGTGTEDSQRKTSFEVLTNGETRVHDKLCVRDATNDNDMVWANAAGNLGIKNRLGVYKDSEEVVWTNNEGKLWAKTKIACAGLMEAKTLDINNVLKVGSSYDNTTGGYIQMYTRSNDTGNTALGDFIGAINVNGKIACTTLVVGGNLLDGTKWTPNSNGY